MQARPLPPMDLLGDESWFTLGSFGEYAEALAKKPTAVNTFAFCGHMSLRVEAMEGDVYRAAKDHEIAKMQDRLRGALREGAGGFSTGLYYPPNAQAPTEEVIAIAEVLRAGGNAMDAAIAACARKTFMSEEPRPYTRSSFTSSTRALSSARA